MTPENAIFFVCSERLRRRRNVFCTGKMYLENIAPAVDYFVAVERIPLPALIYMRIRLRIRKCECAITLNARRSIIQEQIFQIT